MFKATPNPPETDPVSPYATLNSKKLHAAADKALDHYLKPDIEPLRSSQDRAMKMFTVVPDANPEALAIQTYETFSSGSGNWPMPARQPQARPDTRKPRILSETWPTRCGTSPLEPLRFIDGNRR